MLVMIIFNIIALLFYREEICCGTIFKGLNGEIIVDPRLMKPCSARAATTHSSPIELSTNKLVEKITNAETTTTTTTATTTVGVGIPTKVYSDSSSDSGYDESSNQGGSGVIIDGPFKKDQVSIEEINSQIPKINNN